MFHKLVSVDAPAIYSVKHICKTLECRVFFKVYFIIPNFPDHLEISNIPRLPRPLSHIEICHIPWNLPSAARDAGIWHCAAGVSPVPPSFASFLASGSVNIDCVLTFHKMGTTSLHASAVWTFSKVNLLIINRGSSISVFDRISLASRSNTLYGILWQTEKCRWVLMLFFFKTR